MQPSEIICEVPYSHVVFRQADAVYLTFLIGGVASTDYSVKLSAIEALAIKADAADAQVLVRQLTNNPQLLQTRALPKVIWPSRS
jgi:HEAT repeat protein